MKLKKTHSRVTFYGETIYRTLFKIVEVKQPAKTKKKNTSILVTKFFQKFVKLLSYIYNPNHYYYAHDFFVIQSVHILENNYER